MGGLYPKGGRGQRNPGAGLRTEGTPLAGEMSRARGIRTGSPGMHEKAARAVRASQPEQASPPYQASMFQSKLCTVESISGPHTSRP